MSLGRPLTAGIDLVWLPLGAGGHVVRWSGRSYEALCARRQGRPSAELFHSALEVRTSSGAWAVEMTPVWSYAGNRASRGVLAEGAVGAAWAGRSRWFRYEVHAWRNGEIGDRSYAVGGPIALAGPADAGGRLLAALASVPTPVWGRDQMRTGEMWNSNSVTSWALARSGVDLRGVQTPGGGRAPGWSAGIVVAGRP